jgi:hypothetical protein
MIRMSTYFPANLSIRHPERSEGSKGKDRLAPRAWILRSAPDDGGGDGVVVSSVVKK